MNIQYQKSEYIPDVRIKAESCHTVVLMLYFIYTLTVTVFIGHPIITLISFVVSVSTCFILGGTKNTLNALFAVLPIIVVITVINPLFSHEGDTVLFTFSGITYTLQSLLYGFFSSLMICSSLLICKCFSEVMTQERIMYLFGRNANKTGVIFSLVLRFIPLLKDKYKEFENADKALGKATLNVKTKLQLFSATVQWAIENSATSADSMLARGYGVNKRSYYNREKIRFFDIILLVLMTLSALFIFILSYIGKTEFSFYPLFSGIQTDALSIIVYSVNFLMMSTLSFILLKEDVKWKLSKLKI